VEKKKVTCSSRRELADSNKRPCFPPKLLVEMVD